VAVQHKDPRRLSAAELVRLLNSTPLGPVITELGLRRHRARAGYRIGDGRRIDLVRYTAWLAGEYMAKKQRGTEPAAHDQTYARVKERAAARSKAVSAAGRDIAPLPEVQNRRRKSRCKRNFQRFCEVYFPEGFSLPFCPDHLKVIRKIENAVLKGGLFAMAMPRGSGKTTLCVCACIWAVLYGHRDFVCLIGAEETQAVELLDAIKAELENNPLLLADFPEAVYPIRRLEGIANRCRGQLFEGRATNIRWTAKKIVLPTIPRSSASGAVIRVTGITGRIRGMTHKRPDGRTVRPDLVVIDDPQTDESARSPSQCQQRESILAGAVLGLAGPGKKISGIMPCTVIRPGDMADNILDRDKHPDWNGERCKMLYSFPENKELWDKYAEVRAEGLRAGKGLEPATEFYRRHREEMDAGAVVAWPERYNPDELSALQHAMNLKLQDEAAFFAEYQNEPLPPDTGEEQQLTADQIAEKLNRLPQGRVPLGCEHLTAFVDVQQKLLYWLVCAWADDFTGAVIDYGAWPDQRRQYFTLSDARISLAMKFPRAGLEGSIYGGLEALCNELLGREYQREDGARLRIGRCLVDANWGQSTEVIYEFCRRSQFSSDWFELANARRAGPPSEPLRDLRHQLLEVLRARPAGRARWR